MGNFKRDNRPNGFAGRSSNTGFNSRRPGGAKFGGGQGGFRRDSNRPQMHQAICAECGKRCEVPFRPTGDKPVYCSDCFGHSPNYGSQRSKGAGNFERHEARETQMFETICSDCGDACEVPFKPTHGKSVLCNACFKGVPKNDTAQTNRLAHDTGVEELKEIVNELALKVDKVLTLLQRTTPIKEVTVMQSKNLDEEVSVKPGKRITKAKVKPKAVKKAVKKTKTTSKPSPKKTATKK